MTDYFKAVRPDGRDFYTGTIDYLAGGVIAHPHYRADTDDAAHYLSVSVSPSDCTGFKWPARLLRVEPVGDIHTPDPTGLPSKRAVAAVRVVEELPAHGLFGPNGVQVVAYLNLLPALTDEQWGAAGDAAWYAARDAARGAAWDTARYAARGAAWGAAWDAAQDAAEAAAWGAAQDAARDAAWDAAQDAARYAARYAALVLVVRDLITPNHFNTLTGPMRAAGIDFDTLTDERTGR